MQVKGVLNQIKTILTQASELEAKGYDVTTLRKGAETLLDEWKSAIESLPFAAGYNKRMALYAVYVDGEWFPAMNAEENNSQGIHNGSLIWTLRNSEENYEETGTSRFGTWAYIDAEGNPNIEISLKDVEERNFSKGM